MNPTVHHIDFGNLAQAPTKSIQAYLVRLKSIALDCEFSCPKCHSLSTQKINSSVDFSIPLCRQKFSSLWLRKSMTAGSRLWQDTGDQNGKPSTLPYPFPYTQRIIITSIAFCQPLSMHHLQSTFTKVKKENPQLGSNPDYSATVFQFYWYS